MMGAILMAAISGWVILMAMLCAAAGAAMIVFAFIALFLDRATRKNIEETAKALNATATGAPAAGGGEGGAGLGAAAAAQGAVLTNGADYVKALAELAGNLSKVSQAVAALLISTILFSIAATLVTIDAVI